VNLLLRHSVVQHTVYTSGLAV